MSIKVSKSDVIWSYIAQFFSLGSGLITLPLVLHLLSTEEIAMNYLMMTVAAMVVMVDFGFSPQFGRNFTYVFSGAQRLEKEGLSSKVDSTVNYHLLRCLIDAAQLKNKGTGSCSMLVSQLGLENRVIFDTSYRSEGEMRYLYTHADLFVTPSLEEGFGYTPIEAAVLKTPVLISDIPVLKEVTQGKIESFNPHSPEELAEKMNKIISNPPSDEERTALSEFYLREYSLEKQIERFTEVILHNIGVS